MMKINQERYNELLKGNIIIRNDYTDKSIKLINELCSYNEITQYGWGIMEAENFYIIYDGELIGANEIIDVYRFYSRKYNIPADFQVQNPDWFFKKTNTSILL